MRKDNIVSFDSLKRINKFSILEEGSITISVFKTTYGQTPFFYIEPDSNELLPIVDFLEETLTNYSYNI